MVPRVEELRLPKPAPRPIGWLLRLVVLSILAVFWWRLLFFDFARGEAWLGAIPGLAWAAPWIKWASVGFLALNSLRSLLWLCYRPTPPGDYLPTVTAVVPAYNEGAMVRNALLSLAASDYPPERLEILAVDDGSRDDTWEHMQAAARAAHGRIRLIRLPRNQGKRAALSAGLSSAEGEVVVTVDSDCVVAPQALLHLVAPLKDPRVGAVAGRVLVHNQKSSIWARMLVPQYLVTFDFLRAAQSVSGAVLCCPGALSAYRHAAIRPLLAAWSNQTFWGRRVGPGEDRHLTTLLLRAGYWTRYQTTACVSTLVPPTYRGVCRMFLRWQRSDVRESLAMLVRWPRCRGWGRLAALPSLAHVCASLIGVPLALASLYVVAVLLATHPLVVLLGFGILGLPNAFRLAQCFAADWHPRTLYLVAYSYCWPALLWISPYAALTLRDQAWLSRAGS